MTHLLNEKLVSLIYFRALHDHYIEEFNLATDIVEADNFSDICFRVKVKGLDKPLVVFMKVIYYDDKVRYQSIRKKYFCYFFESFLQITRQFQTNHKTTLFNRNLDDAECLFVVYTNAKNHDVIRTHYKGDFDKHLNDLIKTGDPGAQPLHEQREMKELYKIQLIHQITTLAQLIAIHICENVEGQMLINEELVLHYHVILAQKVFNVSEEQSDGHRNARFRLDFFYTDDEFIEMFKDELFRNIRKHIYFGLFYEPRTNTSLTAVDEWLTTEFKVPAWFGNKDLTIVGDDEDIERRLNELTSVIVNLIEKCKPSDIVTIDESVGKEFLALSGGIASAVGNIFVFDNTSGLMRFTDKSESLGKLAKKFFIKLHSKIHDLQKYQFDVKVKYFPKCSFRNDITYEGLVKDFFNKLVFFANQGDDHDLEKTLKHEIWHSQQSNVQINPDMVFSKIHEKVCNWLMTRDQGSYLTKENNKYKYAMESTSQPRLNIKQRIERYNFDPVNELELHSLPSGTIIITSNSELTLAKFAKYLENKNVVVLDLEHILNLPFKGYETLCKELINMQEVETCIVVLKNTQKTTKSNEKIKTIAKTVKGKHLVIITNQVSMKMVKIYFSGTDNIINDKKNNLTDMSEESQKLFLKNTKVIFQGNEVCLDEIVDKDLAVHIVGDVLYELMSNDEYIIGRLPGKGNYDLGSFIERTVRPVKSPYNLVSSSKTVDVTLKNYIGRSNDCKIIKTLYDLPDDVVLITADSGMGKSTLLTHLYFKTKELFPNVWILRINLLDYTKEFCRWQENRTDINTLESLEFLWQVAVSEERLSQVIKVVSEGDSFYSEQPDGAVYLEDCKGDPSTFFELKVFLHFYNTRKMIFLFDGFDEICPDYAHEVLTLITNLSKSRNHKIWITTRPNDKANIILKMKFKILYELLPLTYDEVYSCLNKYWLDKDLLRDLNSYCRLKNIFDFINFMSQSNNIEMLRDTSIRSVEQIQFLAVYLSLIKYLNIELQFAPRSVLITLGMSFREWEGNLILTNQFVAAPSYINSIAEFLCHKIRNNCTRPCQWQIDTINFYKSYFANKFKKIHFEEKYHVNINNPNVMSILNKVYANFNGQCKLLAAYTVFHRYHKIIFDNFVLKYLMDVIIWLQEGHDNKGVIRGVENGMPIFENEHVAGHFAVEYICDLLKNNNCKEIWDFILNVMFFHFDFNLISKFDANMSIDSELTTLAENNQKLIYELLLNQSKNIENTDNGIKSSLCEAIRYDLRKLSFLFLTAIVNNLNDTNLMDFIKIVTETKLFIIAIKMGYEELVISIVDLVRNIDRTKLIDLFGNLSECLQLEENIIRVSTDELVYKLHIHVWSQL